jgi:hypothetical protein
VRRLRSEVPSPRPDVRSGRILSYAMKRSRACRTAAASASRSSPVV